MNRSELVRWIAARGCVTVGEVADVAGISVHTARLRLRRLRRRGVLRVVWRRRRAWWCVQGAEPVFRRIVPGARRRQRTRDVMQRVEDVLQGGCVATAALMRMLGLSHTQAFYALRLLQAEGRAVEIVVGRVAMWCRERDAAQRFLEEIKETIVHLVRQNGLRYIRPRQLFELITRDAKARGLFGRLINVKSPPSASTFSVLDTLLNAVYGDPIHRSIYYTAQLAGRISIEIRDGDTTGEHVAVKLTPDLAEAMRGVNVNEVVLQAIEQLLARYRT
jgi:predicted transcriptional regulator